MKNRFISCIMSVAIMLSLSACGGGAGDSSVPPLINEGIPSVVQLLPVISIAQTNSFIFFKTKVLDGTGTPLRGMPVTFTNLSLVGVLSSSAGTTDGNGFATVTLYSTASGFATLRAEVNTGTGMVRDQKTVFFTSSNTPITPSPSVAALKLDVDDGNGTFNQPDDFTLFQNPNDNTVSVRATLTQDTLPVSGATVTFGADRPDIIFPDGSVKTTNNSGQATVTVKVVPASLNPLPSVLNITASTTSPLASNVVSIFLNPVIINSVSIFANPQRVDSGKTSDISASVTTTAGSPAPDSTTVNFAVTAGTGGIDTFAQTTNGVAKATFQAPTLAAGASNETDTITASVGGKSASTQVTVAATPFPLTITPAAASIAPSASVQTLTFTLSGGTPAYVTTSSDPAKAFNAATGAGRWDGTPITVTIPANVTQGTVTLNAFDSLGATKTATITIQGGTLNITPASETVASSTSPQTVSFTVSGGAPPYITTSTDPTKVFNTTSGNGIWNASTVVATIPANVTAGTVTLNVFDSLGATKTATITIIGGPPPVTPLPLTVIPAAVGVAQSASPQTLTFTLSGGTSPYVVTSSDPTKAMNAATGSGVWSNVLSTFTVTIPANATAGTATLNVFDSLGATKTATITIQGGALNITPASITVASSTSAQTVSFTISGGAPSYITTSTDPTKVFNTISGNGIWNASTVVATIPANVTAGTVTLNVFDSLGATKAATITIIGGPPPMTPLPLTIIPAAIGVAPSFFTQTLTFTLSGGTSPYVVASSDPTKAVNASTGNGVWSNVLSTFTVTIPASATAGTATLNVFDSLGATKTATITIIALPAPTPVTPTPLTIVPGSVTVVSSVSAQPVTFTISGGAPSYITTSTDPTKVFNTTVNNGTWSGSPITVTIPANVTAGTVTLNVFDSLGATKSATVTIIGGPGGGGGAGALSVTPASISLTGIHNPDMSAADNVTFVITGGISPYSMFSDKTAVITSSGALGPGVSTFTVDPDSVAVSTAVTLTIVDSAGAGKAVTVTVTPPAASGSIGLNPSSISMNINTMTTFYVIGSSGLPFNLVGAGAAISSITAPGCTGSGLSLNCLATTTSFTVTTSAIASSSGTIQIFDSGGGHATASITVP